VGWRRQSESRRGLYHDLRRSLLVLSGHRTRSVQVHNNAHGLRPWVEHGVTSFFRPVSGSAAAHRVRVATPGGPNREAVPAFSRVPGQPILARSVPGPESGGAYRHQQVRAYPFSSSDDVGTGFGLSVMLSDWDERAWSTITAIGCTATPPPKPLTRMPLLG
jgi:hypothetical protein